MATTVSTDTIAGTVGIAGTDLEIVSMAIPMAESLITIMEMDGDLLGQITMVEVMVLVDTIAFMVDLVEEVTTPIITAHQPGEMGLATILQAITIMTMEHIMAPEPLAAPLEVVVDVLQMEIVQ